MDFKQKKRYVMPVLTLAKAASNKCNRLKKKDILDKKKKRQAYCREIKEIYRKKAAAR